VLRIRNVYPADPDPNFSILDPGSREKEILDPQHWTKHKLFLFCLTGMKNVMIITSTVPYLGVTKDDGRQKPALYKEYDFG
jgi:hypothetical protein